MLHPSVINRHSTMSWSTTITLALRSSNHRNIPMSFSLESRIFLLISISSFLLDSCIWNSFCIKHLVVKRRLKYTWLSLQEKTYTKDVLSEWIYKKIRASTEIFNIYLQYDISFFFSINSKISYDFIWSDVTTRHTGSHPNPETVTDVFDTSHIAEISDFV